MREIIHEALAGARDVVGQVVQGVAQEQRRGDAAVLARYVGAHRGNPWALVNFAQREAGGQLDQAGVLQEALRYEKEMEGMLRERQGGGGV